MQVVYTINLTLFMITAVHFYLIYYLNVYLLYSISSTYTEYCISHVIQDVRSLMHCCLQGCGADDLCFLENTLGFELTTI